MTWLRPTNDPCPAAKPRNALGWAFRANTGLYVVAFTLTFLPLWRVTYPPCLDYYSHLARSYIYSHIADFHDFYAVNPVVPPNIVMNVLVELLAKLMPIATAGWLFCHGLLLTHILGVYLLNRRLWGAQALSLSTLVACLVTYNWVWSMGFLNYLFALNLMLMTLAVWVQVREKSGMLPLVLGAAAGTLLLFSHVIVFGLYVLIVLTYEAQAACQHFPHVQRPLAVGLGRAALALCIPGLLFLLVFGRGESAGPVTWGTEVATRKVAALMQAFTDGVSPHRVQVAGMAMLGWLAVVLGRVAINRHMVGPLIMVSLVFGLAPLAVAGGYHFDERLPIALLLLFLGAVRVDFAQPYGRWAFVALVLVLLAIQSRSLSTYYREFDAEVRQLAGAFAQLEPQSILAVALDRTRTHGAPPTPDRRVWDSGTLHRRFWHIAALAAVHVPVFVTTTHAIPSQHTILVQPLYDPLYVAQGNLPWKVSTDTELEQRLRQYSELVNRMPHRSRGSRVTRYLLLLDPATLAERTLQHGDLLWRSDNALLVRLTGP